MRGESDARELCDESLELAHADIPGFDGALLRAPAAESGRASVGGARGGAAVAPAPSRWASPRAAAGCATRLSTALANAATFAPRAARTASTASLTAAKAGTRVKKSW